MISSVFTAILLCQPSGEASPQGKAPPAQPASAPSSRPANLVGGGTGADLQADVTFIYELDEMRFKVQESWTIRNDAQKLIDSLEFRLPRGASLVTMDPNINTFKANEDGTAYSSAGPLGLGQHSAAAAYRLPFKSNRVAYERLIPVNMTSARVIVEEIDGLTISANVPSECESRDLEGLRFNVCSFGAVPAGTSFRLVFDGLPVRTPWLRTLALGTSLALMLWMIVALMKTTTAKAIPISSVSAAARRDQIIRALELLKEDFDKDEINEKRYERRRRELLAQLAEVLREIEISKTSR
ncbi:MAG: hypothetical protein AAF449_13945 [Myxococcota bacterium]